MKHELIQGEHVTTPPATYGQCRIRQNIHDALWPYVRGQQLGEVYVSAGFKLPGDTLLRTDASFIRKSQIEHTDPDGYFEGAPALAIEVVSESNTAARLDLNLLAAKRDGREFLRIQKIRTLQVSVALRIAGADRVGVNGGHSC